jgi:hypothetical protein
VRVEGASRYRLEIGGQRVECASIEELLRQIEDRRSR